jgi:hypothetical protein
MKTTKTKDATANPAAWPIGSAQSRAAARALAERRQADSTAVAGRDYILWTFRHIVGRGETAPPPKRYITLTAEGVRRREENPAIRFPTLAEL